MRAIDERDFVPGSTMRIRMLRAVVAGRLPRQIGEVCELPSAEAFELVASGLAERYTELKLVVGL